MHKLFSGYYFARTNQHYNCVLSKTIEIAIGKIFHL